MQQQVTSEKIAADEGIVGTDSLQSGDGRTGAVGNADNEGETVAQAAVGNQGTAGDEGNERNSVGHGLAVGEGKSIGERNYGQKIAEGDEEADGEGEDVEGKLQKDVEGMKGNIEGGDAISNQGEAEKENVSDGYVVGQKTAEQVAAHIMDAKIIDEGLEAAPSCQHQELVMVVEPLAPPNAPSLSVDKDGHAPPDDHPAQQLLMESPRNDKNSFYAGNDARSTLQLVETVNPLEVESVDTVVVPFANVETVAAHPDLVVPFLEVETVAALPEARSQLSPHHLTLQQSDLMRISGVQTRRMTGRGVSASSSHTFR